MLNTTLVDHFRSVSQEGRTGALIVQRGESQIRFYFEGGELLLLDYGIDKELLLLRQYRAYHKIGYEIEAMVEQMLAAGQGGKTKDFLQQQQLVSQDEIEQVTRTLVEDTLCDVFGYESDRIFWDEGADMASFDLDRSAVKLRIQVPLLLTMVEGRVQERDAVRREVPDYGMVFSLVEGAPSTESLNDMELNALHFVDGRKSVEDVAVGIRDSSLNTACYLVSLHNQGFIGAARSPTSASGGSASGVVSEERQPDPVMAASAHAEVEPEAEAPSGRVSGPAPLGTPPVAEPEVIIRNEPPPRSRSPMVLLLTAVLLVLAGVGYLVVKAQQRQAVIDALREEIQASIRDGDWAAAEVSLGEARQQAGNDTVLQSKLDELVAAQNTRFSQRLDALETALEADDIAESDRMIDELPQDAFAYDGLWMQEEATRLDELRNRLMVRKDDLEQEAILFRRKIDQLLAGGSIDVALEEIEGSHPVLERAGNQVLRDWRVNLLTDATDGTRPIGDRERLLDQVIRANPSEENLKTIGQIETDIGRIRLLVAAAIDTMKRELQVGDYQTVIEKANENARLAAGSELAGQISGLKQQAVELRSQFELLIAEANRLVRTSRDTEELGEVAAKLGARVEEMPEAANRGEMERASEIMLAVVDSLMRETTEEELSALSVIIIDETEGAELSAIEESLKFRRSELATREERAQRDIERARGEYARGSLDEAERLFTEILKRDDYRRTDAYAQAKNGLEQVKAERIRREARFGALRRAMLAGDTEAVTRLGREMALPRLPVLIRTLPPGAEVRKGDEVVGTTPYIIEDLSADRVDQELTVVLEGYESVTLDPTDASGGWLIDHDLVRAPSRTVELGSIVTSEPAGIDDTLWLVGKRQVYAIGGDGVTPHGLDRSGGIGRALVDPVYAPVCQLNEAVYVTTRDRIALKIVDGQVTRLPLAAQSDFALASYISPLVLDREVLVVAGREGRLAASDTLDSPQLWTGDTGAPFASAPLVVGDGVLALRKDGTGSITACDTGTLLDSVTIGQQVVAAWREDDAIVGYTTTGPLRWSGGQVELGDAMEDGVLAGAPGVMITAGRQVNLVGEDGALTPIGTYEANRKIIAPPVRWGDHVAITSPGEVVVVGEKPFSVKSEGDLLRPVVVDGQLVVVEVSGKIRFYSP